jgi:hypothetical protein
MERAVNADRAEAELLGCPREVTRLHEREDDLEVAKGDLFVDSGKHDPDHRVTNGDPRWMLARANARGRQRDRRPPSLNRRRRQGPDSQLSGVELQ